MTDTTPTLTINLNTYLSLDDADAIAGERLFASAWTNADEQTRIRALCTATALLDRLRWNGRPVAPTQKLAWPRVPQACPQGYPLSVAIPDEIRTACVELAVHLLSAGQLSGLPVQQRMLGDSMVIYFPMVPDELPKHVRRLIEPHLRVSSAHVAEMVF